MATTRWHSPPSDEGFEKLALKHMKDNIPASLDHRQFSLRASRATEDPVTTALHSVSHTVKIIKGLDLEN